jgi:hypothetical protein
MIPPDDDDRCGAGWHGHGRRGEHRHGERHKSPVESIIAGSAFTVVFGFLFVTRQHEWWWIFPAVFAGVLPLLEGLRRAAFGTRGKKDSEIQKEADAEKQILRAAHEANGRLTASIAALKTNLTIKEAQGILERMTREGHAVMNVTNEGLVVFEFPEFLPRLP